MSGKNEYDDYRGYLQHKTLKRIKNEVVEFLLHENQIIIRPLEIPRASEVLVNDITQISKLLSSTTSGNVFG